MSFPKFFLGLALTLGLVTGVQAGEYVAEVDQPIEAAFPPEGYDTDDNIEIMVTGFLAGTCIQLGMATTEVKIPNRTIEIGMQSYKYEGFCLRSPIAFSQTVSLGQLRKAGRYTIIEHGTGKKLGELEIVEPKSVGTGTDETTYAALSDAYLVKKPQGTMVVLSGVHQNSCMAFQGVEVKVSENAVTVRPRVRMVAASGCQNGLHAYRNEFMLNQELPKKAPFLLHVRSASGQVIQKIIYPGAF